MSLGRSAGIKPLSNGSGRSRAQASKIIIDGKAFAFPPLGPVPQKLIVAGGAENVVRERLAKTVT